ncbi:MAG: hypothetical protein WCB12_06330 [Bryobacteraceae bacterium]
MWFRSGILTLSALGAFLSLGQSNLSFTKVKLVEQNGRTENANLVFLSDQKLIAIYDSHQTVISIPYNKVMRLSYWRAEHSQTAKKVAVGAMTWVSERCSYPKSRNTIFLSITRSKARRAKSSCYRATAIGGKYFKLLTWRQARKS